MAGEDAKKDPTKKEASTWSGIPEDQILDFKKYDNRFVVVTVAGQKVSTTKAERDAAAKAQAK